LCFSDLQRKFCSILFFHSVLFVSSLICQTPENFGYLRVAADSIGIEIRLNDQLLGYTPLPIICLPPGNYQIVARHPNPYVWGNFDWQDSVTIVPHDTLTAHPVFKTLIAVRTNPFDASVFLNNEYQGNTPLAIPINSHKNFQLLLKKDGFQDYLIDLNQVRSNFLTVDLIKNYRQLNLNQFEQQQRRRSKHRYRAATYSLWGLSILTGLSTVYLKDQADGKYRQYLVAGSLRDMNKYYNDSKRYDRYSYVSLGVLQGCFMLSFYFLMKSLD
jgi:hypothetical protein